MSEVKAVKPTIEVGQQVLVVPGDSRYPAQWRTVAKIGRKWVTLSDRDRFEMDSMLTDNGGYGYCSSVYLSEQDYDAVVKLNRARSCMRKMVARYGQQPETTVEKIEQAIILLGYDVDEFRAALTTNERG